MINTPIIDYHVFGQNHLPPKRRLKKFIAWVQGMLNHIVIIASIFQRYFRGNDQIAYFDIAVSYSKEDEVIYNYKVYKSLSSTNLGNIPDANINLWYEIMPSFIGAFERSKYTAQKISLEWALNRYFKFQLLAQGYSGFKQPDDPITPSHSDIYISNFIPTALSFVVYKSETNSSVSFQDHSSRYVLNGELFGNESYFRFYINIPTSVFTEIHSDAIIAETIVRSFADKYVPAGIFYFIKTY
jgi:hypothetical protein